MSFDLSMLLINQYVFEKKQRDIIIGELVWREIGFSNENKVDKYF